MEWFTDWWREIGIAGQVLACMAVPASIVLLLQAILALFGVGFGEEDVDIGGGAGAEVDGFDVNGFDADGFEVDGFDVDGLDADGMEFETDIDFDSTIGEDSANLSKDAMRIITIRGIIAFFAIGGWAGLVAVTSGLIAIWSVIIAIIAGTAAMLLAALVIKFILKMQSSGNINLTYALSQTAEVYITIPPSRSNTGKVMILLQERLSEIEAVTDETEAIKTGQKVFVDGTIGKNCLLVSKIKEEII